MYKVGYVPPGDGDVFDCGADNIAFGLDKLERKEEGGKYHWDYVSDAVTGVDDRSSEGTILDFGGGPGCCESEHSLYCYIQPLTIE